MNQTNELARTWFISFQTTLSLLLLTLCVFFVRLLSPRLNLQRWLLLFTFYLHREQNNNKKYFLFSPHFSLCTDHIYVEVSWEEVKNVQPDANCWNAQTHTHSHFWHIDISKMYVFIISGSTLWNQVKNRQKMYQENEILNSSWNREIVKFIYSLFYCFCRRILSLTR